VVLIDSDVVDFPKQSHHDLVSLDHVQASYTITKHMIEQNIRNIHFLSPPMSAKTIKLRQIGFREALFDYGLPIDPLVFHQADPRDPIAVRSIISLGAQGILCSNDGTAITLLETLRSLDVVVPRDMVVAGFDNLSYLSQIRTPLTSISQPTELISQEAVRLMLARVKHPQRPFRTVRFPGTLIIRRSTRYGSVSD
jgi:LacI family transcriptional regulator